MYESELRDSVLGIAVARYSVFDHKEKEVVNMIRTDTMEIDFWNEEKKRYLLRYLKPIRRLILFQC